MGLSPPAVDVAGLFSLLVLVLVPVLALGVGQFFFGEDRLLANGVARSAARRKTGGLQWHGFLWAFGARNGRKNMGHGAP
jgi:hypothetical protein